MPRYRYAGITEQRRAALRRREDAHVLRLQERWRGAMYLLGYAIECSLKARLMERFRAPNLHQLQEELARRLGQKIDLYSHSLNVLFEYTKSEHRLNGDGSQRRAFNICRK